ncbi:hypothetical protein GCM10020367_26690 [Streptomyces sannanensis]|uniref:DUF4352 domain-containing protein n=1 Tax=Streptomyces sannanensis TaxID=285536 RepID=A0ABP6SB07_9ACTN
MSQHTQQPQFPQAPFPQAPAPQAARNGLGTAALILGIIGAFTGLFMILFWLAGVLGLIALILGLAGRGRVKRGEATNKGVTITGAVLGLVSLILSVVGAVVTFKAVDSAVDEINKATKEQSAEKKPGGGSADGKDKGKDKNQNLAADDSVVYDDDLTVTVSAPKAYTPGEFAIGHTKGNKAYTVTVTIDNAGKEKFDTAFVQVDARAGANGVKAEQIFDDKTGSGMFEGTVLPGKKATVEVSYDAPADAKNLTVEVNPGLDYDSSQWDLKL